MNNDNSFQFTYSAPVNQEVLNIRKKYLPREETGLEELKRLDALVQSSGLMESLSVGTIGALVFGLGMCLSMGIIGHLMWLGILLGLAGAAGMIAAFPVYQKYLKKTKEKYTPRILELTSELIREI